MFEDAQQEAVSGMCAWCGGEIYQDDDIWYDGYETFIHNRCLHTIEEDEISSPIASFVREDYRRTTIRDIIMSGRPEVEREI